MHKLSEIVTLANGAISTARKWEFIRSLAEETGKKSTSVFLPEEDWKLSQLQTDLIKLNELLNQPLFLFHPNREVVLNVIRDLYCQSQWMLLERSKLAPLACKVESKDDESGFKEVTLDENGYYHLPELDNVQSQFGKMSLDERTKDIDWVEMAERTLKEISQSNSELFEYIEFIFKIDTATLVGRGHHIPLLKTLVQAWHVEDREEIISRLLIMAKYHSEPYFHYNKLPYASCEMCNKCLLEYIGVRAEKEASDDQLNFEKLTFRYARLMLFFGIDESSRSELKIDPKLVEYLALKAKENSFRHDMDGEEGIAKTVLNDLLVQCSWFLKNELFYLLVGVKQEAFLNMLKELILPLIPKDWEECTQADKARIKSLEEGLKSAKERAKACYRSLVQAWSEEKKLFGVFTQGYYKQCFWGIKEAVLIYSSSELWFIINNGLLTLKNEIGFPLWFYICVDSPTQYLNSALANIKSHELCERDQLENTFLHIIALYYLKGLKEVLQHEKVEKKHLMAKNTEGQNVLHLLASDIRYKKRALSLETLLTALDLAIVDDDVISLEDSFGENILAKLLKSALELQEYLDADSEKEEVLALVEKILEHPKLKPLHLLSWNDAGYSVLEQIICKESYSKHIRVSEEVAQLRVQYELNLLTIIFNSRLMTKEVVFAVNDYGKSFLDILRHYKHYEKFSKILVDRGIISEEGCKIPIMKLRPRPRSRDNYSSSTVTEGDWGEYEGGIYTFGSCEEGLDRLP